MGKIELSPQASLKDCVNALLEMQDESLIALVEKINEEYEYWDMVKYKPLPKGCTPQKLWLCTKASRLQNKLCVWPSYAISLSLTSHMQRICHEFDMNFGGTWMADDKLPPETNERYLVSSLMEEAISSSQMEGANTTRRVAKEMLRKQTKPKDKAQQMIANNYQTIQFIVQSKDKPLTPELLLHVHRLMTEKTLSNDEDAGRFRTNDEVVVADGITHEVVHRPPSHQDIEPFVAQLCCFFNDEEQSVFIHPLIRGIIIHFMLAYVHPFVDGNGRTARAVFYWYMLKSGYWLTEYLSISRIIKETKKQYEKAFLHTEADDNDLSYFITYQLRAMEKAFEALKSYINRKQKEIFQASQFMKIAGVNDRMAQIIKIIYDDPERVLSIKEIENRFLISNHTARTDLKQLVDLGFLEVIPVNKKKQSYIKSASFYNLLQRR